MEFKSNNIYKLVFIAFIVLLIAYAIFNSRFLLAGPQIILNDVNPKTNIIESVKRDFLLRGVAIHSSYISVNGKPISVDEEGYFEETLLLSEKANLVKLMARDRFGKEIYQDVYVHYVGDRKEPTFDEIISTFFGKPESSENASSTTSREVSVPSSTSSEF